MTHLELLLVCTLVALTVGSVGGILAYELIFSDKLRDLQRREKFLTDQEAKTLAALKSASTRPICEPVSPGHPEVGSWPGWSWTPPNAVKIPTTEVAQVFADRPSNPVTPTQIMKAPSPPADWATIKPIVPVVPGRHAQTVEPSRLAATRMSLVGKGEGGWVKQGEEQLTFTDVLFLEKQGN